MAQNRLSDDCKDALLRWAAEASPLEACGFQYGDLVVPVTNVLDVKNAFQMHEGEVRHWLQTLGEPDGVWHSHPEGQELPSNADCRGHVRGKRMFIVTLTRVLEYTFADGYPMLVKSD